MKTTIKYGVGDLLRDANNFDVIIHCANCFCRMGSGIAKSIKEKYPEAYQVDLETKTGDRLKLGGITYTKNTTPTIVNAYGQYTYGGQAVGRVDLDYKALTSALRIAKEMFSGKRFGLPKLGSGLAVGDPNIIRNIIEKELAGEDVVVLDYNPKVSYALYKDIDNENHPISC
jgi:O-acetyl-ADP-ribose deacetylase (regulator of RNase III)